MIMPSFHLSVECMLTIKFPLLADCSLAMTAWNCPGNNMLLAWLIIGSYDNLWPCMIRLLFCAVGPLALASLLYC